MRTSIINLVYKKSLRLSSASRQATSIGEMTNLVAVNAQQLFEMAPFMNMIWSGPFQIGVSVFLLWRFLGPASLVGLCIMAISVIFNIKAINKRKKLNFQRINIKMIELI